MRQAANFQKVRIPLLLPGINVSTSPTDFYPIQAVQLSRFKDDSWELFGDILAAEKQLIAGDLKEGKGRPPAAFLWASALRPRALQGLAALGGIDAAVLVDVAAREIAIGPGPMNSANVTTPSLSAVEQLEVSRLPLRLAIGRQDAVADCRRAGEQFLLGELAVAIGVQALEAGLLAGLPFGAGRPTPSLLVS